MSFETLIAQYGYAALFGGTCLEGESFMIAAGFAAHRGYLSLPIVCIVGAVGSFVGDQLWYYIGRARGIAMIAKRPSWQRQADRIRPWIERRRNLVILGSRFAYGLRTVTPVLLGSLGIPPGVFALWNAIGAVVWSVSCGVAGYFFGHTLELMIGGVQEYELPILASIFAIAAAFVVVQVVRARIRIRSARERADVESRS